ncbi:MAG: S8 family serine peptidase [Candidatus Brocadiia bacterium]
MKAPRPQDRVSPARRTTLSLEALEPRVMLSADGMTELAIAPEWFEALPQTVSNRLVERFETQEIDWQGQTMEVLQDHWMVQFSAEAMEGVTAVGDASSLLTPDIPFEIVKGMGRVGQVLIRTGGASVSAVDQWLGQNPNVALYAPDGIVSIAASPTDPLYDQLWGMENTGQYDGTLDADIDVTEAWDLATGGSSVVVAVADTGVDYNHEDLADNMWVNVAEYSGAANVDDDGNGFVDDIYGFDFYDYSGTGGDGDPMDENGHGTHVAGTIGAVANNGVGVAGVNWNASIMALRFLGPAGDGDYVDAGLAVNYATMMKQEYDDGSGDGTAGANVRVVNHSWRGYLDDVFLRNAMWANNTARQILHVCAAGNEANDNDGLFAATPASYDLNNVISVAATDRFDEVASFSNFGRESVDLAAPGVAILSTLPPGVTGQSYGVFDGTSMASPHVAGAATLALSYFPGATMQQVRGAILGSAQRLPSLQGMVATEGRLDVRAALERVLYANPEFIQVDSISSGGTTVTVFDCRGRVDVSSGDVGVGFSGDRVDSISVAGSGSGIGLTIAGASSVGRISDARSVSGPFKFIASDSAIERISLNGGVSGALLNGQSLGGILFPLNIDGDTSLADRSSFYTTGYLGDVSLGGALSGDVWIGSADGTGYGLGSLTVNNGGFYGQMNVPGHAGPITVGGDVVTNWPGIQISGNAGMFTAAGSLFSGPVSIGGNLAGLDLGGSLAWDFGVGGNCGAVDIDGVLSGNFTVGGDVPDLRVGTGMFGGLVDVGGDLDTAYLGGMWSADRLRVGSTLGELEVGWDINGGTILARDIGTVTLGGSLTTSWLLAGADLGDDWALGGTGSDADTWMPGTIQQVTVGQAFDNSLIGAGLMPVGGSLDLEGMYETESFLYGSSIGNVDYFSSYSASGAGTGVGSYEVGSVTWRGVIYLGLENVYDKDGAVQPAPTIP